MKKVRWEGDTWGKKTQLFNETFSGCDNEMNITKPQPT